MQSKEVNNLSSILFSLRGFITQPNISFMTLFLPVKCYDHGMKSAL